MKFPKWREAKNFYRGNSTEYIWHYNSEFWIKLREYKTTKLKYDPDKNSNFETTDFVEYFVTTKPFFNRNIFDQFDLTKYSLEEVKNIVVHLYIAQLLDFKLEWAKTSSGLNYSNYHLKRKNIDSFSYDYCIVYNQSNDKGQYVFKYERGLIALRNDYMDWRLRNYNKSIKRLCSFYANHFKCS